MAAVFAHNPAVADIDGASDVLLQESSFPHDIDVDERNSLVAADTCYYAN